MYSAEFPARRDAFARVRSFVEEACERSGVPHVDCLRLTLLVEELFVNTVTHGHGGDTDAPVRLTLTVGPADVAARYEDTARAFDPFSERQAPDDAEPRTERQVGGLGIRLITSMAEDIHHVRREGWNEITFRLARTG